MAEVPKAQLCLLVHQLTTAKLKHSGRIHDVGTRNDYIGDHGWLASYSIHELNEAEYTARRVMQESKVAIEIMRSVGKIAHRKLGYD